MANFKSWLLTDLANDIWLEPFELTSRELSPRQPSEWSVRKRTLRGGLRDGVEIIEVRNGALEFTILPTRGMGLWRGSYRGHALGWRSPVQGPVHPQFVNLMDRGGLGWLSGFDEWICRCGLSSNGPPGHDPPLEKGGQGGVEFLPLHGRIANSPAHRVEVQVNLDPPHEIMVVGEVDESTLFFPQLRLRTAITTAPGSAEVRIDDEILNLSSKPAELELLYHCQFGPPFLEGGSRVRAPIREVAPRNQRAAEGIDHFEVYPAPTRGFVEQVYFYDLLTDPGGQTLALLHNAKANLGVTLRFAKAALPRFIVWKNTAAEPDGYVTGLEPATNYPNFKAVERDRGRVIVIPPGGVYRCGFAVSVQANADEVAQVIREIDALQSTAAPVIHRTPREGW